MTRKPLKTELHHWWPRSLQEHWCDADGCLFVVRPDGKVIPSRPGNFGAITNAHHMKIGGPWDATFEPVFNRPDSEMQDLVPGGRWAVLFSDVSGFIFGDGFLHNFPASADGIGASRKCLLPFTPTAMIVNMLPVSHPDEPRLVTMRLRPDEVQALNGIVQVYSKEFLFYRSQQPTIDSVFSLGQFRQYKYHQHAWADTLLDDLAQYNLWGPGGTPSRCAPDRDKFDLDAFMARYGLDQEP